jgi:hypothetical protein
MRGGDPPPSRGDGMIKDMPPSRYKSQLIYFVRLTSYYYSFAMGTFFRVLLIGPCKIPSLSYAPSPPLPLPTSDVLLFPTGVSVELRGKDSIVRNGSDCAFTFLNASHSSNNNFNFSLGMRLQFLFFLTRESHPSDDAQGASAPPKAHQM